MVVTRRGCASVRFPGFKPFAASGKTNEWVFSVDNKDNYLYTQDMNFTWNPGKRLANQKKHGLDFADAERVFSGDTQTFPDNRFAYGEMRYITVGMLDGTVVAIAHTESETEIRVISMRKAERHEQKLYFASRCA
ncbi:MAG: BrnT family toxin [Zoogloeaceae bacterium]|nr:BrnT family toxin [Zoogloeaceae bacterium]